MIHRFGLFGVNLAYEDTDGRGVICSARVGLNASAKSFVR